MRIYEAKISYKIVQQGTVELLDSPDKVAQYLRGAFDAYPLQESFWVVALDRKNKPMGRSMVTLKWSKGVKRRTENFPMRCCFQGSTTFQWPPLAGPIRRRRFMD
jgi:hypothetical protein